MWVHVRVGACVLVCVCGVQVWVHACVYACALWYVFVGIFICVHAYVRP